MSLRPKGSWRRRWPAFGHCSTASSVTCRICRWRWTASQFQSQGLRGRARHPAWRNADLWRGGAAHRRSRRSAGGRCGARSELADHRALPSRAGGWWQTGGFSAGERRDRCSPDHRRRTNDQPVRRPARWRRLGGIEGARQTRRSLKWRNVALAGPLLARPEHRLYCAGLSTLHWGPWLN